MLVVLLLLLPTPSQEKAVPMANKATEPRVPMTLQRSRLKAEEKTLDFEFEVVNVQFNKTGRYALRLTVENLLLEGSGAGVKLRVNEGDAQYTTVGTTDIIEQSNPNEICSFERRKFIFTLPKGERLRARGKGRRGRDRSIQSHISLNSPTQSFPIHHWFLDCEGWVFIDTQVLLCQCYICP